MEQNTKKSPRIEMVDALRGFAVMAILMVHSLDHFIFPVYPTNSPAWLNALDAGVFEVVFTLFSGKAYAIFAMLFGFTFYIQMNNQRKRGGDFGYRFLWRMIWLTGFATLNAAFFPAGDVLLLFATVSIVLFLTRNLSDKAVLCIAVLFFLQPFEWYHYIAGLLKPGHRMPYFGLEEMYAEIAECTKAGNFRDFILMNITLGQKVSLAWAFNVGRISQTVGLFLLGFFIGRKQMFVPSDKNLRLWTKVLITSAVAFAPLYTLRALIMGSDHAIQRTAGTAFSMWQNLAFTMIIISSFVLLYQSRRFRDMTTDLRYYGRMSLTNYLAQSVIGALIYFPFGLYLAPYCGYTLSLVVAVAIFVLQVRFCKWWFGTHKQGPLEHIWHKLTWIGTGR
ncbi:MAG: DUF418 domain-containing protein [Prevotella sp.]|nr:DUF418 domain-containing protein [Prevotella sp.]